MPSRGEHGYLLVVMISAQPWLIPNEVPLPHDFVGFDPTSSVPDIGFTAYHRHLPHWRKEGASYLVTFRLTDSLPAEVVIEMKRQAKAWLQRLAIATADHEGRLPEEIRQEWGLFQSHQLRKLDQMLDEGRGECVLREKAQREIVTQALHYFEGRRLVLHAYVVMPNHVHVLGQPLPSHSLENLCGSWKRHTSRLIQGRLNRRGSLWQAENFDRIIRDPQHFAQSVRYIAKNPLKAGLSSGEATVWMHPAIRDANGWAALP